MKKASVMIIVVFLLVGAASLLFCGNIKKARIDGDGAGYFSYLPAVFVDHDLSLKTLWDSEFRNYLNGAGSVIVEKDGKYLDSYTVGVAILEAPFF